jgi:hypothetical protein
MFRLGYQVNCGQGACAAPASLKLNNNKPKTVRCPPPHFPHPQKAAVANSSRHLVFDEMTFITLLTYFKE